MRLNELSKELAAARRDIGIVVESLALFIRYQLMVTPPIGDNDEVGRAQGCQRLEAFISQVGRPLATVKRTHAALTAEGGEGRAGKTQQRRRRASQRQTGGERPG